jgi:hypothetical protein
MMSQLQISDVMCGFRLPIDHRSYLGVVVDLDGTNHQRGAILRKRIPATFSNFNRSATLYSNLPSLDSRMGITGSSTNRCSF